MQPQVIMSVIQSVLVQLPHILEAVKTVRGYGAQVCPQEHGVELLLLSGGCLLCRQPRFVVLRSEEHQHWSVHCPGCGWSITLDGISWWGRAGRFLIQHADLLSLGTVRKA
jgi:hypothetical protein